MIGDDDGDGDTECAYHDGLSIFDRHLQAFGEVFSIHSMHLYHISPCPSTNLYTKVSYSHSVVSSKD